MSLLLNFLVIFGLQLGSCSLIDDKHKFKTCTEEQTQSCFPGKCVRARYNSPEPYSCVCGKGYYFQRTFNFGSKNPITTTCIKIPYNPCDQCSPKNTILCTKLSDIAAYCKCHKEFSSISHCLEYRNACTEIAIGATVTGNYACQIDRGNICIPVIGTDRYSCVCSHPFQASINRLFPNCLGEQVQPCDNYLCAGIHPSKPTDKRITPRHVTTVSGVRSSFNPDVGHCLTENNTFCRCPSNWFGRHCTQLQGNLKHDSWTPWSPCHPDCFELSFELYKSRNKQSKAVGYVSMQADCSIEEKSLCVGKFRVWRRCKVQSICGRKQNSNKNQLSQAVAVMASSFLKNKEKEQQKKLGPYLTKEEKVYIFVIFVSVLIIVSIVFIISIEVAKAICLL